MTALGVLGNVVPHELQPQVDDGVHLRWSPGKRRAFPWHGYHLFRREHRPTEPVCVLAPAAAALRAAQAIGGPTESITFAQGRFSSDAPLRATDMFAPSGQDEFVLDGRSWLRLDLPPGRTAWLAEAMIGFLGPAEAGTCVDFNERQPGQVNNGFIEQGARFDVHDYTGNPAPIAHIVDWGHGVALDVGLRLVVALPAAAREVRLSLASHSRNAEIIAKNDQGDPIDTATVTSGGIKREVTLRGAGITSVVVNAPSYETLLYQFCFDTSNEADEVSAPTAEIRAFAADTVVASTQVTGAAGDQVTVTLRADAIDAVDFTATRAVLIDLCYRPVSLGANWTQLNHFPYAMSLPVRHPNYPASSARPTDPAGSEADALGRIRYGDPADWAGPVFADLHDRLVAMVSGGPGGPGMAASATTTVTGLPASPDAAAGNPALGAFRDLSWLLLASLHPAVAQQLGTYWVDESAIPGTSYDYLIIGDDQGVFAGSMWDALDWANNNGNPTLADAWICWDVRLGPDTPPAPPTGLRVYALPGSTRRTGDGTTVSDASNNAGLRWAVPTASGGSSSLTPGSPVSYHLWRSDLGTADPTAAPAEVDYAPANRTPLLVPTKSAADARHPADWPPLPMHAVDSSLGEGWYAYQVSSVDVFGRHSRPSAPAQWWQWMSSADPAPWYVTTPGDRQVHPYAVALLDKTPPPPPTAIEAQVLDPLDPTVWQDATYRTWRAAHPHTTGVRVRWRWTEPLARQAPDATEFRVYLRPGQFNALPGRAVTVTPAGRDSSLVTTDLPNMLAADAYTGAVLQQGGNSYAVLGSRPGTPLRLQVRNLGPEQNRPPTTGAVMVVLTPTALAIDPARVTSWPARVQVVELTTAVAEGIEPSRNAAGQPISGSAATSSGTLVTVDPGTNLAAVRAGVDWIRLDADQSNAPHLVMAVNAANRALQLNTVPVLTTASAWRIGTPYRQYDVLLPISGTADLIAAPTLAEPLSYAQVGVSTTDDKTHSADLLTTGAFSGRTGNEGPVGGPRDLIRVRRTRPDPPMVPPADADRVYATPADYHSRSFFTYRWVPSPELRTHVYRASDESVFAEDWRHRPRADLTANSSAFPPGPHWTVTRKEAVAAALNTLNQVADRSAALVHYRALTNDALCVLAGLPETAAAFLQLTIAPLDPDDSATADRRGPDSPGDYQPSATLRAYADTLDGRSSNRYFYRSSYVDPVQNAGPLSLATPPVWLPDVTPPRAPRLTSVTGGNEIIRLRWWSNREPDLTAYRIYRAADADAARDVRLMELWATVPVAAGDPSARPAEVGWADGAPVPYADHRYRLTAVDRSGNESSASAPMAARAYSTRPPEPPDGIAVAWADSPAQLGAQVTWVARPGIAVLVERAAQGTTAWRTVGWTGAGAGSLVDPGADPVIGADYRLRARDAAGRPGPTSPPTSLPPAP